MTGYWIGAAAAPTGLDVVVNLGPTHPTRAGAIALDLTLVDGQVTQASVETGFSHRGAEKLFEVRDLRQGLALADRHEWQAPFSGELALALAVEEALGITCSPRTTWLRMLAAEHCRLHAQLACLTWLVRDTAALGARIETTREALRQQLARWSGSRVHPMLVRIGGIAADIDDAWWTIEAELAADGLQVAMEIRADLASRDDLRGIGVVDAAAVASLGLSGATARAAGVAVDVRRDDPYLAYSEITRNLAPVQGAGDAHARFAAMVDDVRLTASLLIEILGRVDDVEGPLETRLPKILRLPEGEWYRAVEGAFGETGLRVVSRGEKSPWRVSLRTAGLPQVMALPTALRGAREDDIEAIVASLPWVIGDVDK